MSLQQALDATLPPDGRCPIDIPAGTRLDLARWLAAHQMHRGAEIGVERGVFAEQLLSANPSLHLLCVDAWAAYPGYREHVTQAKLETLYAETQARLGRFGARVQVARAFSVEAARDVPRGSLDFVYLDAAHDLPSVIADLAAWVPTVRAGGIVAGHDFRRVKGTGPYHVKDAVHAWTSAYRIRPWYVLRGETAPTWFWVQP